MIIFLNPKSSFPLMPCAWGGDGWLTDQLLNGGLSTGFLAPSWINFESLI